MAQQKREVTAIANNPAPPTFDNTVVAMETIGPAARAREPRVQRGQRRQHQRHAAGDRHQDRAAVRRAQRLHLSQCEALPALQVSPRSSGRAEPQPRAGEAARRLLQAVRPCRRRASARQAGRAQDHQQAAEHAVRSAFSQKLLAAAKAGALHVDDPAALAGLSPQQLAAAQEAAKDRKLAGYVLPLQNTTQQPALSSLTSHDTRQQLFEASLNRAEHGDANDTRAIVSEIAQLRAKKAALFGAANFADYNLYDQMAKDRATAVGFLDRLGSGGFGQSSGRSGPTSWRWPSRRARTSSRPRPTGISTPSRSASSATRSIRTS